MATKVTLDLSEPGATASEVEMVGEEGAAHDALVVRGGKQQLAADQAAAEDTERLRTINERARTDPAYAALADIVLRGLSR